MKSLLTPLRCFVPRNALPSKLIYHSCRQFTTSRNMSSNDRPGLSAAPAAGQHVWDNDIEYKTISEGLAHILVSASADDVPQTTPRGNNEAQPVFYNPIQQFNRDLTVLAIKAYGEEVVEGRRKEKEALKKKLMSKKEKKRKREQDGLGEAPRKTGKIEETGETSVVENPPEPIGQSSVEDIAITQNQVAEDKATSTNPVPEADGQNPEAVPGDNSQPPPKPAEPAFTILDALSATGLRALRYAHELPFVTSVTANDLLTTATEAIQRNVTHNGMGDKINVIKGNALAHMYSVACDTTEKHKSIPNKKYDVIDLDPYGSAAMFLDAAVQAVKGDGGLLCVTCTDPGVWASNGYPEKCYSLYGGISMKGVHSHEAGLRLILHAIATSAARYGLAMEPLLSLSVDYYGRVFVRIYKSAADVKFLAGKTMLVYNCDAGCGAWSTQMIARNKLAPNKNGKGFFWKHVYGLAPTTGENCNHCGSKTHLAGPMFGGPIHSPEFIKKVLESLPSVSKDIYGTRDRVEGMLTVALEESLPPLAEESDSPTLTRKTGKFDASTIDHYPFFFIPSAISKIFHCVTPHENALRGALRHLGYRVTRSHAKAGSIKTDAPWAVIWEVMREWVRQKAPVKEGAIREKTPGWKIMGLDRDQPSVDQETTQQDEAKPKLEVVFNENLGKENDARKVLRYQINPRENWGPMARATGTKEGPKEQ